MINLDFVYCAVIVGILLKAYQKFGVMFHSFFVNPFGASRKTDELIALLKKKKQLRPSFDSTLEVLDKLLYTDTKDFEEYELKDLVMFMNGEKKEHKNCITPELQKKALAVRTN